MANNYYGIPVGQPAQYTAAATPYPAQYTATPIVGQTRSDKISPKIKNDLQICPLKSLMENIVY